MAFAISKNIRRERVTSSNLDEVGYDPSKKILEVRFHNGKIYQYHPVTEDANKALRSSDSVGKYFSENIVKNPGIEFLHINPKK